MHLTLNHEELTALVKRHMTSLGYDVIPTPCPLGTKKEYDVLFKKTDDGINAIVTVELAKKVEAKLKELKHETHT